MIPRTDQQAEGDARRDARHGQGDAVIDRQDQTNQRLAVNEADQRVADEPRLPADGFQGLPRQVGVDMRDHPIPIAQQEETHDRRHHDERHDIEDRQAAGDHPLHEAGQPGHRLGQLGAEQVAYFVDVFGGQMLLEQEDQPAELVLKFADESGNAGDQLDDLALDQRHQDH